MEDDKICKHFGDYLGTPKFHTDNPCRVDFVDGTGNDRALRQIAVGHLDQWMVVTDTDLVLRVLDQLLVVLMLVEILRTVRISIRSHTLVTEPFLVVSLIASIRRILAITLEAATLTKAGKWTPQGATIFHASMIELGLLGPLVFVLAYNITLLRRSPEKSEEVFSDPDAQREQSKDSANVVAPSAGTA
jgi:uncharacterized membrane protein (DUF373 family)